jgi:hypothetical protein
MLGLALLLHLACTVNKPCSVTLKQSPELHGFRLGMSLSDIQNRFPGFPAISPSQFGLATVEICSAYERSVLDQPDPGLSYPLHPGLRVFSFVSAAPFAELKELKHIELKLVDGRLTQIALYYPDDIKWKSADEFAQKTGESLRLDGGWRKVGEDGVYSENRSMHCGGSLEGEGFFIHAGLSTLPLEAKIKNTKLPYVKIEDFWAGHMKEYDRQVESEAKTKREEEERKQQFKP